MPDIILFLLMSRRKLEQRRWDTKLRLGLNPPAGLSIQRMGIEEFDPGYAGRWNAGSNNRAGGVGLSPEDYFKEVQKRLERRD